MTPSYPDNVTQLFTTPVKPLPQPKRGEKLDQNIAHFVRVLRRAGLRVGPAATLDCVEASKAIDIGNPGRILPCAGKLPCEEPGRPLPF